METSVTVGPRSFVLCKELSAGTVYKGLCLGTWPCMWGKRGECRPSLWGPMRGKWVMGTSAAPGTRPSLYIPQSQNRQVVVIV